MYSGQLLSHVRLFVTPWTATHQASLSITEKKKKERKVNFEIEGSHEEDLDLRRKKKKKTLSNHLTHNNCV